MGERAGRAAEVVVAGHVCLDVIPALEDPVALQPGRLVTAGPATLATGGAVANVGLALHRLGVPARLVGRVGDDVFGRALTDALRAQGPRLADDLVVAAGEATSYSVVISPPGTDRTFVHCPGANDTFTAADVRDDHLAGARILHFGYPPLMRRMYADGGAGLLTLLQRARAAGAVTSLDLCDADPGGPAGRADWRGFMERVLPAVDLFVPSLEELAAMLGHRTDAHGARLAELSEEALGMGAAVVVIKLGDQGLHLRTSSDAQRLARLCATLGLNSELWRAREVLAPCFEARSVAGTTGSGDATIAGLLAALLRGEDPVSAATSATAVGACSVEAPDATSGIGPWPEVAERIARGWPRMSAASQETA